MVSWVLWVRLLLTCPGGKRHAFIQSLEKDQTPGPSPPPDWFLSMRLNLGQTHHSEWWPLSGPYPEKGKSQFTLDLSEAVRDLKVCVVHM